MNLLEETIEILNENGKSFEDINFAMIRDIKPFLIENFSKDLLNVDYDNSYGL